MHLFLPGVSLEIIFHSKLSSQFHPWGLLLGLIWYLSLLLVFTLAFKWISRLKLYYPKWKRALLVLAVIAFLTRLVPAVLLREGAHFDVETYQLVYQAWKNGQEIYGALGARAPYLPFWYYISAWSGLIADFFRISFFVVIKIPSILADVGSTILIFKVLEILQKNSSLAFGQALLFALNPVSLAVTAYHGQFDAVALFFLMLAIYLVVSFGEKLVGLLWSAVVCGLAIFVKTWPLLVWPLFILRQKTVGERLLFVIFSLLTVLLCSLSYLLFFRPELSALREALKGYGLVYGYWGYPGLLALGRKIYPEIGLLFNFFARWGIFFTLVALWGIFLFLMRKKVDLIRSIFLILLFFITLNHAGQIQYLSWIISPASLLLTERRNLFIYSLLTGLLFIPVYFFQFLPTGNFLLHNFFAPTVVLNLERLGKFWVVVWAYLVWWVIFELQTLIILKETR